MPQAGASRLDQNLRLNYHQVGLGALEAGQESSVNVNYSKVDPEPSLTWEQVMALQEGKRPPETISAVEEPSGFRIPTEVYVFVGGALLILVGSLSATGCGWPISQRKMLGTKRIYSAACAAQRSKQKPVTATSVA